MNNITEIKQALKERPSRPDCFEFGMHFMDDPEETIIREYVQTLESALDHIEQLLDGTDD